MRTKTTKPPLTSEARAKAEDYRSGLEEKLAQQLKRSGVPFEYEKHIIRFVQPEKRRYYRPDYILPNGIIIESKGIFTTADRQKHLFVKQDHPGLDIRFVFSRSTSTIGPKSETTYAKWCDYNGFLYADKWIPQAWLDDPLDLPRMIAVKAAMPAWDPPTWP